MLRQPRLREPWCHAVEQHDVAHLLAGLGTISTVTVPPPEYPHDRTAAHLGVVPSLVTADRGSWDSTLESDLAAAGVTTVIIPRDRQTVGEARGDRARRPVCRRRQVAHRVRETRLAPQPRLGVAADPTVPLTPYDFHGEWNYTIKAHTDMS